MHPRIVSTTFLNVTILWQRLKRVPDERFFKYMVYYGTNIPVPSKMRWQNELPSVDVISTVNCLQPNTSYAFYIRLFQEINVTTYGNPALKQVYGGNSQPVQATTSKL